MAEPHSPIGSLLAVRPDHSKCLSMLVIIGCNHTTLSGCQVLRSVEAENCKVGNAPDPFTIVLGAMSLSRVLDHRHTFTPGSIGRRPNVRRQAEQVSLT